MPDIFLSAGEPNPNDIRLSDPTVPRGGSTVTYTYAGTGGLVFAGASALARTIVPSVSGGITFAGTGALSRSITYTASGGVLFAGTSAITVTHVPQGSGGKVFGGAATTSFVPAGGVVYTYSPSGGMTFTGDAATSFVAAPVVGSGGGWITWTIDRAFDRHVKKVEEKKQPEPKSFEFTPLGGCRFGGSAKVSRTRAYVGSVKPRKDRAASSVSFTRVYDAASAPLEMSGRAKCRLVSIPRIVAPKKIDHAAIAQVSARRRREENDLAAIFSMIE